ncbi:hypothetical protein EJ05DRAFT_474663 [Pseudovirgaria hyperparasitica]|uniref:BTB domain-containing protein n=1 Tax=Pseudovirgaria hyperparasitica TaxID=470096 RepID=A0A6A6W9M3_9PEZI|nr:uncharacterized protein EJ05DRAFT_474663 [Pseudovirgaria hyperparasitica]KAF2759568.1 hypothetical protein EJ05DRAFT_474663 [Pseudovirgaria hyperparasitica]
MGKKSKTKSANWPAVEDNRPLVSPYEGASCTLTLGDDAQRFNIPQNLLQQFPKFAELASNGHVSSMRLSDVDDGVAHTLVHFLFTRQYQTLRQVGISTETENLIEYDRSIKALCAATAYELADLAYTSKKQAEYYGTTIPINLMIQVGNLTFMKLASSKAWFLEHLRSNLSKALQADVQLFAQHEFMDSLTDLEFTKAIFGLIVELLIDFKRASSSPVRETDLPMEEDSARQPRVEECWGTVDEPVNRSVLSSEPEPGSIHEAISDIGPTSDPELVLEEVQLIPEPEPAPEPESIPGSHSSTARPADDSVWLRKSEPALECEVPTDRDVALEVALAPEAVDEVEPKACEEGDGWGDTWAWGRTTTTKKKTNKGKKMYEPALECEVPTEYDGAPEVALAPKAVDEVEPKACEEGDGWGDTWAWGRITTTKKKTNKGKKMYESAQECEVPTTCEVPTDCDVAPEVALASEAVDEVKPTTKAKKKKGKKGKSKPVEADPDTEKLMKETQPPVPAVDVACPDKLSIEELFGYWGLPLVSAIEQA